MPEESLLRRESSVLRDLERLAAERARAEQEIEETFRTRRDAESKAHQNAAQRLASSFAAETETTQARYRAAKTEVRATFQVEDQAAKAEEAAARKRIATKVKSVRSSSKKELEDQRWHALAMFEAAKDGAIKQFKERESEIASAGELLETIKHDSGAALAHLRKFAGPPPEAAPPGPPPDDPIAALHDTLKSADEQGVALSKLGLPRFLTLQNYIFPFLLLGMLLAYPLLNQFGLQTGLVIDGVVVIVIGVAVWIWLAAIAKRTVKPPYHAFQTTLADAERLRDQSRDWAKATLERTKVEIDVRRGEDVKKADQKHARVNSELELWRIAETKKTDEKFRGLHAEIQARHDEGNRQAEDTYPRLLAEIQGRSENQSERLEQSNRQQKDTTQTLYDAAWNALTTRWRDGLAAIGATVADINAICRRAFLDWSTADLDLWKPPPAAPPALRFGEFTIALGAVPEGVPRDDRLKEYGPTSFALPALLDFPARGSLLVKAADAGRAEAVGLLQAVMLRLLTSVPPGKVRFTIIDPVGLGENFAAFMHLADYHDLLVTSRIWTETPHIEQRLADLSAHMENVIQKYLRNEFESIEQYNAFAGEVAEPFRVLVVANFPVNFSDSAARRLISIAGSGARCGVYTLISVDMKQQLPAGIQLKDLEPFCVNLAWREGRLHWRDPDFGRFPLQLDASPGAETVSRLMHLVGTRARDANRVEVPFDFIAPAPAEYWTSDSRAGIDVPLGRAGATKLQHLRLGKGTSQHVLIAGKTGSGKSTLLHALITNAALRYSPDELEMYLIDFKKGVEFKVYAAFELPHARVIAVESEREFGLSVLQRLDQELKVRGDRFRDLGVQDLRGYRDLGNGAPPLPRILFIVDEFQEFFVEDDKIAQDVGLLLDRLVRQGRAFGIHVHLGSQSLGGAYSLARSTIGQMAVRIALQCSDADSHLILSEDNSAARLLTRPGEAIYNDANGMVEGNNFFQIVWLSDARREEYLQTIQALNRDRGRPAPAQIVFEGNLPAVAAKNLVLNQLLAVPAWPESPKADVAWLGEAIAIKDPTAATFRSQSGSNLLMIGQNDEGVLGMMMTALIGLAAQHDPTGVRFYVFDGSQADSSNAGRLGKLADVVPHPVREVVWRDLKKVMAELGDEVERRQAAESSDAPNLYLIIFDLQRFRDLRKADDDYGFSKYGEEKETPPSKRFGDVLRDGPPVGVHTIVWCDSLNNLNRTFDRQALKEFEIRVLFQMSANDSSTLIDSPAAGKLGTNRALYFNEEEGRLEKFRPYGPPDEPWLAAVRAHFQKRPTPVAIPAPEPVSGASS